MHAAARSTIAAKTTYCSKYLDSPRKVEKNTNMLHTHPDVCE